MRFEYADARMPFAMKMGSTTYFLTYDQVGSLRTVVNASGTVVKRIDYDSFGNIISETNQTLKVPFGFAGGLHDRDTGLVRFGYRDYDPDTGRWTAKDPIGFGGGDTDIYGYCVNDPVNFADPWGLIAGEKLKQNIKVSPGDPIGDKILDVINNKTLDAKTRNELLKEIEQEIAADVCKGARKNALKGLLKYAKAMAKYALKYGGTAAGIVLEAAFPVEANEIDDVEMMWEHGR